MRARFGTFAAAGMVLLLGAQVCGISMGKEFVVKGVNPLGRIVEVLVLADTAADARAAVEDIGLLFVVVNESVPPTPRPSGGETPPVDGGWVRMSTLIASPAPIHPKLSPRTAIYAVVTLIHKRTANATAEFVRSKSGRIDRP